MKCIQHHSQLFRFLCSNTFFYRSRMRSVRKTARVKSKRSPLNSATAHEISFSIIQHFITINVAMIVRRRNRERMIIKHSGHKRTDHEIPSLEERLRSRFEWGLIADIQPPDLETKIAILKKKAETEAVPLRDDVAIYIAGKIKSNIRELEGSLIRLIAYASLTGRELSIELAQDVLRNVIEHEEKAVTIDSIQKFVSDYYQLKLAELKSRNNSKSIAMPRQVAMYLCKALTHASLPEIGRSFGGKHHSTVIHSIKKVELLRKSDEVFNSLITNFLESFH